MTDATLGTLGERLSDGEVADLAPRLPDRIAGPLVEAGEGGTAGFSFDVFVERVGDRTGATDADALRYSRAVGATLVEAVGREEFRDARSQLPNEYDRLFWAAGPQEFVDRVADRAGVEADVARAYVRAVTAAFAEAIPDYEYRNVLQQLPDPYGPLLGSVGGRDEEDG